MHRSLSPTASTVIAIQRGQHKRRGILTAWSVLAMLMAGVCASLVFNHLWLSAVHTESLHRAEASALAAAQALLTDDLLRLEQQPIEHEWRMARGQAAALNIAERYRHSRPVAELTAPNVVFLPRNPADLNAGGLPETVVVRIGQNASDFSRLQLPGVPPRTGPDSMIQAVVRVEHHPSGFQPLVNVPVPMMPLGIIDDPEQGMHGSWTHQIEQGSGHDRLSWSDESQFVALGPDGLPEITLTLHADLRTPTGGQLSLLKFCRDPLQNQNVEWQIHRGISLQELTSAGFSKIQFPQDIAVCSIPESRLNTIGEALSVMQGRAVIWNLVELNTGSPDAGSPDAVSAGTVRLSRPVAARIMHIRMVDRNQLDVTLQPCVLVTVTAVMNTAEAANANRYIYRTSLGHP